MTDSDTRAAARLRFARAATGLSDLDLVAASSDAGFRSYWRSVGAPPSRIVMDSPPDKEDVRPWLAMRERLAAGGVRVPALLAAEVDDGFLLLEDLGAATCLDVVDGENADALYRRAIDELVKLAAITPPADIAPYDEALLGQELALFDQWFLGRHLGIELELNERAELIAVHDRLITAALAQPQILVHRDYIVRNLMPLDDGGLAVIDFQDAVRGPLAYDPISLLKDAFISWPEARVEAWLGYYHARATEAGLPAPDYAQFRRDADLIGVQRHLKVIGIFARLNYRDGKPRYLTDAPRFIGYLDAVLPRYPELAPLARLLETRVKPALRGREVA